ncbi:MAG: hypothetical protein K5866_02475 [Treponema sp.]|nr:hypothetical protein [Treponema sp.]
MKNEKSVFTANDFCKYLKRYGVKITLSQATDLLRSSNIIFPLINDQFITRAGAFTNKYFSFKPSKEEVEKGYFLIGHRGMPFVNPEINPDSFGVYSGNGESTVIPTGVTFSMNLAMDVFALFGEGYVLPYILNDRANKNVSLSSVQYNLPSQVTLTAWPISQLKGGKNFTYGDRILCRVIDWESSSISMSVLKNESQKMSISKASIERENWYSAFEDGLLQGFDKHGPMNSIEEQLALLFLENQESLIMKNCGSCEEFLKHTKKIAFSSYGVESRIWKSGQDVPYIGQWNKDYNKELILADVTVTFTPTIVDAYLLDYIANDKNNKKDDESFELLFDKVIPSVLKMNSQERELVLLNMKKRHDILKKSYSQFSDYKIAPLRRRILTLFSDVSKLLCDIANSGIKVIDFPQQELVVLSQLFSHTARLLEEVVDFPVKDQIPLEELSLSLEGMEETFDGIRGILTMELEKNRRKGFEIIS